MKLEEGESVVAEAGAMMLMRGDIKVRTINIDLIEEKSKIKL